MGVIKVKIDGVSDRHAKNPKTAAQTLQRVLVKVVAFAYARLKAISNHSFEGVSNGFECMNKFKKLNLKYLRERAATLQNSGQSLGDQLTFVTVQKREGKYEVNYARLILNPRNADGSGAPMTTEIVDSQGEFPCSNWKNRLNFSSFEFDTDHFNFVLGRGGIVVAAGIIVSRKDRSGDWFRSNCQLVLNEAGFGSDLCSLSEAVERSYLTADIDMESDLYLNNAGGGGTGATQDVTPSGGGGVEPGQPAYNNSATINGVSQNIAGGTVTATAPVTTVTVSGTNLGDVTFTAKVDGTGDTISPASHDASGASFTGLNVEANHSLMVYRGGTLWFTITAQPPAEGGDDI